MLKLTDSQLIVLSKAAARDDGAAVAPQGMGKAAAAKVGSSLVARKLMREIRCKARHADLAGGSWEERQSRDHPRRPRCDRSRQTT